MNQDRPKDVHRAEGDRSPAGLGESAEADLIELVLASRAAGAEDGGVPADPSLLDLPEALRPLDSESRARALELRAFLDDCRAALTGAEEGVDGAGSENAESAAALAERVLAATTREDLSWRGDLRLVGGFVVQRLRNSRMLRIAAVVLAMHFVGLSVLAYHILRQPSELYLNFDFEERPELPYPEEILEPAGDLPLPETAEEPRVRDVKAEEPEVERDR